MKRIALAVEKHRDRILETERYLWAHPETGYKEVKSSAYVAKQLESLGYTLTYAGDIPGFVTVFDTGRPGPEVLIFGELDSVICPSHPEADPETGAVHSCGHNAQCAALVGIAAALKEPGIADGLCGRVRLCAVPAEELLEISYRSELIRKGTIKYYGGKTEFLSRGLLDGADLAFMIHTATASYTRAGAVGLIPKRIIYKGKAAHAGGAPWNGNNALYAATCGIQAVNALRETFREADLIRFHPIITRGGDIVNAIPEQTEIETYVRGASFAGIKQANARINRALAGAALSLGCNVEIVDAPGYAPELDAEPLNLVAEEAFALAFPDKELRKTRSVGTGSSDMGDISCVMPAIQPHCAGAAGTPHGRDYSISDPEAACLDSALWQLAMLKLLLEQNASRAKEILAAVKPQFTKEEFLAYQDSFNSSGDRITYLDDGTATVRF